MCVCVCVCVWCVCVCVCVCVDQFARHLIHLSLICTSIPQHCKPYYFEVNITYSLNPKVQSLMKDLTAFIAEYIMAMNLLIVLTDLIEFWKHSVSSPPFSTDHRQHLNHPLVHLPNCHVPVSFPSAHAPYGMSCYNKIPGWNVFQG